MIFALLDSICYPAPRTHKLHIRKLAAGFQQLGFQFQEIKSLEEIKFLGADDLLYISNHFSTEPVHRFYSKALARNLKYSLSACEAKILLWNFHTVPLVNFTDGLPSPFLHLGEKISHISERAIESFRARNRILELDYSSAYDVCGEMPRRLEEKYDFQFVGRRYSPILLDHCKKHYVTKIDITPPIINEIDRINSYRRSFVNLVFHSVQNLRKGIIVERFAEAASLGGIIFHDHPQIEREFRNVQSFFYVSEASQIDTIYRRLRKLSEDEVHALRLQSFNAWAGTNMSYRLQAQKILNILDGDFLV